MKPVISSILSLSLIIGLMSAVFSYRVAAIFFIFIITISTVSILFYRKSIKENKNKNLYYLIFVSFLFIIFLATISNIKVAKEKELVQKAFKEQIAQKTISQAKQNEDKIKSISLEGNILMQDKSRVDIDVFMQSLQNKIQNNIDRNLLLDYFILVEQIASQKISSSTPKTYLDMGKVYEAAYVIDLTKDQNLAISNYKEYIKLQPKDHLGYATLARFLALNKANKKEAVKYAQQAYDLSEAKEDKRSYSALISYIKSLN